jgi:hypothetical protein
MDAGEDSEQSTRMIAGFRSMPVFDVAQTGAGTAGGLHPPDLDLEALDAPAWGHDWWPSWSRT